MTDKYFKKAKFTFFGIDDELKEDSSSIYTTIINSSRFNIPPPPSTFTIDELDFSYEAVAFSMKKNTKRYRFSINNNFKNLKLTTKAKLVIESICIPNVISKSFLQSKCVNNIMIKMLNIPNNLSWDSSSKGKGGIIIFTAPVKLNTQGFGIDYDSASAPDALEMSQKARLNTDNNGILYINPEPNHLFNYPISDDFLKNGIFEFEIIYDIGDCWKNTSVQNEYLLVPQTLVYDNDKDNLEGFQISMIILDYEDEDTIYNEKELLNTINKVILKKM